MQYAIFEGMRSIPIATGQRADCPGCGNEVLSKCGEINVHHWAHLSGVDCDLWSEPETPWHRNWKNRFPEEWREVFIKNGSGEWHRADVAIPGGPVIEFQHSNLNSEEIRKREEFYTKHANGIIWIVDGEEFMDRWVRRSWERFKYDGHTSPGSPFDKVWFRDESPLDGLIPRCSKCNKLKDARAQKVLVKVEEEFTNGNPFLKVFKQWNKGDKLPGWATGPRIQSFLEDWNRMMGSNASRDDPPKSISVANQGMIYSEKHKGWVYREKRITYRTEYIPHWMCCNFSCKEPKVFDVEDRCDLEVLEKVISKGYMKKEIRGGDEEQWLVFNTLYDELPINLILPHDFPEIGPDQLKPVRWPHARKSWAYAQERIYFDHSKKGVFEWLGTVNEGGEYYENARINTRSALNLPKYIVGTFQSKKDFIAVTKDLKDNYSFALVDALMLEGKAGSKPRIQFADTIDEDHLT